MSSVADLRRIIRGSSIAPYFSGIWGCRCIEDPKTKTINRIQNTVDFTLKTRYLFEINKGLVGTSRTNPFLVNLSMEEEQRRIPFENMIYCGDGLTDVAAFSLLQSRGGTTFALFNPTSLASRKRAWHDFLTPHRVTNLNTPRFAPGDDLERSCGWQLQQFVIGSRLHSDPTYRHWFSPNNFAPQIKTVSSSSFFKCGDVLIAFRVREFGKNRASFMSRFFRQ